MTNKEQTGSILASDEFRILVVGSRGWNDAVSVYCHLDKIVVPLVESGVPVRIVSGGALGADSIAQEYAYHYNLPLTVFRAEWTKYGKRAGFVRNEQMHEFIAEVENRHVLAFWDGKSKGTTHSFRLAEKYNNPLTIVTR